MNTHAHSVSVFTGVNTGVNKIQREMKPKPIHAIQGVE